MRLLGFLVLQMSCEKPKLATEGVSEPILPPLSVDSAGKAETPSEPKGPLPCTTPSRIAVEHNYAKLIPFRTSHSAYSSFSTVVLFADRVSSKLKKKSIRKRKVVKHNKGRFIGVEEVQSHGEVSTEEGESSTLPTEMEVEPR